jgi:hypothetical protein
MARVITGQVEITVSSSSSIGFIIDSIILIPHHHRSGAADIAGPLQVRSVYAFFRITRIKGRHFFATPTSSQQHALNGKMLKRKKNNKKTKKKKKKKSTKSKNCVNPDV